MVNIGLYIYLLAIFFMIFITNKIILMKKETLKKLYVIKYIKMSFIEKYFRYE